MAQHHCLLFSSQQGLHSKRLPSLIFPENIALDRTIKPAVILSELTLNDDKRAFLEAIGIEGIFIFKGFYFRLVHKDIRQFLQLIWIKSTQALYAKYALEDKLMFLTVCPLYFFSYFTTPNCCDFAVSRTDVFVVTFSLKNY